MGITPSSDAKSRLRLVSGFGISLRPSRGASKVAPRDHFRNAFTAMFRPCSGKKGMGVRARWHRKLLKGVFYHDQALQNCTAGWGIDQLQQQTSA